jgi:hypothetical protein
MGLKFNRNSTSRRYELNFGKLDSYTHRGSYDEISFDSYSFLLRAHNTHKVLSYVW